MVWLLLTKHYFVIIKIETLSDDAAVIGGIMANRVLLIVIDGFGIGWSPDAALYGDEGANTFASVHEGLNIPVMEMLGLFDILPEYSRGSTVEGAYGKMSELSKGKDTSVGHFELAGYITRNAYKTYPDGFPDDMVKALEKVFGTKIIGNRAASGTEIINRLGVQHLLTGYPIVYTSADSVMQIATHVKRYSVQKLYEMCLAAKSTMNNANRVGRVIARPFDGEDGAFYRTPDRKDFGIAPEGVTLLDKCKAAGLTAAGVGKIYDIFCGKGVTKHYEAHGNAECYLATCRAVDEIKEGLIFVNLVDTDMLYGHRNDISGYKKCLETADSFLGGLISKMTQNDLLIVTADHGCDPAFPTTDHTREYVPLLIYGNKVKKGLNLGTLEGFNNVADIAAEHLSLPKFRENPLYSIIMS